ncbi:MAG: hypothetical protein Tsb0019_40650 [Roseibium sp.]
MRVPETYTTYANGEVERNHEQDLAAWLMRQPQDARLVFVRCNGYDDHARLFEEMIADPDCDLAVIALIFWRDCPASKLTDAAFFDRSLTKSILENTDQGYYRNQTLSFDPIEIVPDVQDYIESCKSAPDRARLFEVPRKLCLPHRGRPPRLPDRYDGETERELEVLLKAVDAVLPRSEEDFWKAFPGRYDIPYFRIPDSEVGDPDMDGIADTTFLEKIFGSHDACRLAMKRSRIESKYPWSGAIHAKYPGFLE